MLSQLYHLYHKIVWSQESNFGLAKMAHTDAAVLSHGNVVSELRNLLQWLNPWRRPAQVVGSAQVAPSLWVAPRIPLVSEPTASRALCLLWTLPLRYSTVMIFGTDISAVAPPWWPNRKMSAIHRRLKFAWSQWSDMKRPCFRCPNWHVYRGKLVFASCNIVQFEHRQSKHVGDYWCKKHPLNMAIVRFLF